jgi:hypothetical protein
MGDVKVPRGERAWVSYNMGGGILKFLLTSKENNRDFYFLYEVLANGSLQKLGKARSPTELEKKFELHKRLRGG